MDPSWNGQKPVTTSAILTILIWASLCKSFLSQDPEFRINVRAPPSVSVQQNHSIHVPCQFNYSVSDRVGSEKLYGYWFQKSEGYLPDLVATNDNREIDDASLASHFQFTGDPEEGNCSFSIQNAQPEDTGKYYFEIANRITMEDHYFSDTKQVHTTLQVLETEGLLSQNLAFTPVVPPASVSVQRGLCVHIPCQFTPESSNRLASKKLHGYWFRKRERSTNTFAAWEEAFQAPGILVATDDNTQKVESSFANRFQLTGHPEEGNCSFSILNAQSQDKGEYFFRTEMRPNFPTGNDPAPRTLQVLVTEFTEKPEIVKPPAMISGKEAVVTCLAPGPCSKIEPDILWTSVLTESRESQWSQQHKEGSWVYGSNFTFTPSLKDHGRSLTCRVWYPHINQQVENRIVLDVTATTDSEVWGLSGILLLIVLCLIKVLFCFVFFFSVISSWRKAPLRRE